MVEDICKLIRIMLDFESSNAGSLNSGSSLNQVFNEYMLDDTKPIISSVKKATEFQSQMINLMSEPDYSSLKHDLEVLQRRLNPEAYPEVYQDQYDYLAPDKTFHWYDIFNIMIGLLEGAMGAIPSNKNSLYCSTNSTSVRKNTYALILEFS